MVIETSIVVTLIEWIVKTISNKKIAKRHGWKAYKKSYDTYIYAQEFGGRWKEIEIRRAYRRKRGDFYIDFKNPDEWKNYPYWAHDRETIMRRVYALFPDQL